jgi:hypothetical protein
MKKISYLDVITGKIERIGARFQRVPVLITLMVAPCAACREHKRISIIKEIVSKIGRSEAQAILLFGKGNDAEMARRFLEKGGIINDLNVGIVQDLPDLLREDYFAVFRLDIDPYSLILNRDGNLIYLEEESDARKITANFLLGKLR